MEKLGVLLIILLAVLSGCASQPNGDIGKPVIVATFYPFYDIAKNIAGDGAIVSSLVPPGSEPHTFEPTPGDIIRLNNAGVFISTGVTFSEWETNILSGLDSKVKVINASEGIEILNAGEHEEEHEDEQAHGHDGVDPHYWVSPKNAVKIALNIKVGLVEAFPEKADYFEERATEYIASLEGLDKEFSDGLSDCGKHKILTTHAAFAYLGRDYGFEQVPILGLSPDSEPTPNQIASLVEEARKNSLKYIFYEELADPRVSETIAQEVGAETLVLNPVAGSKNPESNSYISIMKDNLRNLRVAMECK